jgi:lipopolysaccharide/colanic/teichoic acid biosynthesis glycosyltransferase/glycosyltransferase involved in cell wall biosynthesis
MREPVAIVHDWLTAMRGGERVVEVLCNVFPRADLFTLTWDPSRLSPALAARNVTTSAIHRVASAPLAKGRFRALLPLFPLAVESFKLDRYPLVISSSHCVALGALAPPGALHIAYVHSTLRYVREAQAAYEKSVPGGALGRAAFRGAAHYLRNWETAAAARPDVLVANSTYTRDRIRRYYGRDALVLAPPIETARFERAREAIAIREAGAPGEAPFLLVSALVPNKRVDLAVRAFHGRREQLVVVGEGPERGRLERLRGPNVTLLPRVDEARLESLVAGCRALLHTAVDDFGMVMVEALAAGKPVIACAEGGALDIVHDGKTGLWIDEPTVESVRAALDRFGRLAGTFDPRELQASAKRFDREQFERRFAAVVDETWRARTSARSASTPAHANGVHHQNGKSALPVREAHNGASTGGHDLRSVSLPPTPVGAARPAPNGASTPPSTEHSTRGMAAKRLVDVTLAASGLMLTAPLLVTLAALIPIDSPGPALFFQRRLGLNGHPFTLVKLRTMHRSGEITRLGRVLRPMGLDELPQLWNVLKGEMSLIGPRPEVPERAARFETVVPGFGARHGIRPGITGWAQVNGLRGNVSIDERLRFDIQYLRERSLALDGRILMRTLSTVVGDTIRELRL